MAIEGSALELLCDQSLTDTARIIGLRIAALGGEWHEIAADDFARMVAGYPKQETIARHVRQLEVAGYIERKPGGRGHSDRFKWADRPCKNMESKKDSPEENTGSKDLDLTNFSGLKPIVVVEGGSSNPPIVPLRALDPKAEELIGSRPEQLTGCRGSFRDYLVARVPASRQYAYVQTVIGWLEDIDPGVWRLHTGGWLPPPERTRVLAAALNDLAASDEATMKRPVGDVANLRTKINVLLRKRGDHERNGNTDTGRAGAAPRAATGTTDQSARRNKPLGYED